MESLEQQIANKCIHFTGMGNLECLKNVLYENVKIKWTKPHKFPCLNNSVFTGGKCEHCEFPSEAEIEHQLEEMQRMVNATVGAYSYVAEKIKDTNLLSGKLECPECKGTLRYQKAEINGHIHAECEDCDLGWME